RKVRWVPSDTSRRSRIRRGPRSTRPQRGQLASNIGSLLITDQSGDWWRDWHNVWTRSVQSSQYWFVRVGDDRLLLLLGAWDEGTGPRWRRLADRLGGLIADGALPDGSLLPTERALARRLELSRATVAAAFDHLAERNLLVSRQGSGTRVCRPA